MGLLCGSIVGCELIISCSQFLRQSLTRFHKDLIYASGSRVNLSLFLVVSTNILFLIGAGLFSKAIGAFEKYKFNTGVGGDVAETVRIF